MNAQQVKIPYELEAEMAVLGAIFIEPSTLIWVSKSVSSRRGAEFT